MAGRLRRLARGGLSGRQRPDRAGGRHCHQLAHERTGHALAAAQRLGDGRFTGSHAQCGERPGRLLYSACCLTPGFW